MAAAVICGVVVGALYWMQEIFIPLALAILLTFLLSPPVRTLQRWGLGRMPAVLVVVILAATLLGGAGWLAVQQVTGLVQKLPAYSSNIKSRIKTIRELGHNGRLDRMIKDVGQELKTGEGVAEAAADPDESASDHPKTVIVRPDSPIWVTWISRILSPALASLGALALSTVLVIFMLLKREDLRNRFLRLVGQAHLSATTKAIDEASQRISRFLLTQAIVNATYGLCITAGLLVLRVEYAVLWGFLAALLRYVPYLGPCAATAFAVLFSLAIFEQWSTPLAVLGFFVTLELLTGNFIEPRVYRQTMGVSEVALLMAAAFWAWLWGPIGLVLSAPFTVILVVLGKYVPQVEFLDVLLGDEPALDPHVMLYQRLLARDQDEAAELVMEHTKKAQPGAVYDELLVPLLNAVKRDHLRSELTSADEEFALQATQEILEDLGERRTTMPDATEPEAPANGASPGKTRLLAFPARDETDRLSLEMLGQLLDPTQWDFDLAGVATLTSEMVDRVAREQGALICIGSLPPGGLAHTRYLCKRLRARFPTVRIVVGRWGLKNNLDANRAQLEESGADYVEATLLDASNRLKSLQRLTPLAKAVSPDHELVVGVL